jgi:hypothetical protein
VIDGFTIVIVITALVFNILNFFTLKNKHNKCDFPCYCKYSDNNVRNILMEYDLYKSKKTDKSKNKIDESQDDDSFEKPTKKFKI